jgi:hypothetical protein
LVQAPTNGKIFFFQKLIKSSAVLSQPLEPFVEKIIFYLDKEYGSFKGSPKFPQFLYV